MPFRRNRVDSSATLDLSAVDLGPPPETRGTSSRRRRQPMAVAAATTATAAAKPPTTAPVSRARINGLAGLCMLVLVVSGLGLPLPGGHLAADAIFVIVGFQLGLGVIRLAGSQPNWLRRFWLSAIAPLALPVLVALTLASTYWWWLDRLGPIEARGALASMVAATNLTPLFNDASFAAAEHLWLISLIVQFAVLAPLAARVNNNSGRRTMLRAVIALVAAVAVTRLMLALTGLVAPSTLAQLPLTRMDGLLLGLGVAVAPRSVIERIPKPAVPVALAALVATFLLAPDPNGSPSVALGLLIPVVVAATALIVASSTPGGSDVLGRAFGWLGPRWLGERAISIYVWHRLFGMALTDEATVGIFGADWPGGELFVTRLVFALAAGAASYRYLQLPLRTEVERLLGRRTRSTSRPPTPSGPALSPG